MKTSCFRPILVATTVIALASINATTVIPPTFDELVGQAQEIFDGAVVDVRSEWVGEGAQRRIVSHITFRVEEPIKGDPGATYTLRMFGGTINGETMGVADGPVFKKGDRDILFVENNGSQFIPLVGIMHGRFRVRRDSLTGREFVTTDTGRPVTDLSLLGHTQAQDMIAPAESALGAAEFKAAIRRKLGINGR